MGSTITASYTCLLKFQDGNFFKIYGCSSRGFFEVESRDAPEHIPEGLCCSYLMFLFM